MGRYHSYINSALKILQWYKGEMPFSIFIKQFFANEKKYGSKDRKQIASLCFSWYRTGTVFEKQLTAENLLKSFFLVTNEPAPLLEALNPEWNMAAGKKWEEKIQLLQVAIDHSVIFPYRNELNEQTDNQAFYKSFLYQPGLFIRIRPNYEGPVIEKLKAENFNYQSYEPTRAIQLATGCDIERIFEIDKEVVIQDYNSQRVLDFLKEHNPYQEVFRAWDCCAASGGKSILLYNILKGNVQLTVSDIRQSILANLQQRFKKAGIKNYHSFIADVSTNTSAIPAEKYDIIICDAPCTGSGTWSRTPEQLYFFNPASIDAYAIRQRKIATNVLPYLKAGGLFFYITCSVFKKENEAVAQYISQQSGMELIEMKNLYGYENKADSMFVSVFKKI